jgi:hypothetical protein
MVRALFCGYGKGFEGGRIVVAFSLWFWWMGWDGRKGRGWMVSEAMHVWEKKAGYTTRMTEHAIILS